MPKLSTEGTGNRQPSTSTGTTKERCPECASQGKDTSADNLVRYPDGGAHCFACGYHLFGDGEGAVTAPVKDETTDFRAIRGQAMALPHRKINEDICSLYGYHIAKVKDSIVEVANYYRDGVLIGQKIRLPDKRFFSNGNMKNAPLFGQHKWRHGGLRIVVTEGEIDCLSVAQLLKGKWPVVSLPNGASGAVQTFKNELEFLSSYDSVILCFDMDGPGQEAALGCAKLLPPGKAKIVSLPRKDANEMLKHNESAALSTALWEAKTYRPDGIVHVSEVIERPATELRIYPYPWEPLNKMLYGQHGGSITMYTSGTGMGKSTFIRELAYNHLISGRKVGMIMLEEDPSETMNDMIGLELKLPVRRLMAARKLNEAMVKQGLPPVEFDLIDTLTDEMYEEAKNSIGERGLYLYDHRGENLADELVAKIEYMAVSLGCDVVVLDHISVVVSMMEGGNERQDIDVLMKDLRSVVSRTGIHLDCVTQLRKADGKPYEEGGRITSQDLRGSASLSSVPNTIIAIERNQQHPDKSLAHTMLVRVLKDRFSGNTGVAMAAKYNSAEAALQSVSFILDEEGRLAGANEVSQFKPDPEVLTDS